MSCNYCSRLLPDMQGISVYSKAGRPTWYVAYDCPITAKRVCKSTGIRIDDPRGKMAAYAYARDKSCAGVAHGQHRDESSWENWVEPWLRMRFAGLKHAKTLTSYLGAWKFLSFYFRENNCPTPRALTYSTAVNFVLWRESQVKKTSKKKVSRNTALHNIKVLSRIMREAIRRGYASGNPAYKLSDDVPAAPVEMKQEFTNEQIALVRAEFARCEGIGRPSDWMPIAFEIALHQNCRLSATQIPFDRIDLVNDTIQFHEKGDRWFTVPIHPGLRPLLVRLKSEGRKETCVLPRFASRNFTRVLRRLGLPHSFHSTRVTGITRMARAGVSQQQAMAYVHHGSWAVHKIYTRLKPADIRGCHQALDFSGAPAPALGSPQSPGVSPSTPTPSQESNTAPRKSAAQRQ